MRNDLAKEVNITESQLKEITREACGFRGDVEWKTFEATMKLRFPDCPTWILKGVFDGSRPKQEITYNEDSDDDVIFVKQE